MNYYNKFSNIEIKIKFTVIKMTNSYQSYTLCLMHSLNASFGGILFGYFMAIYNPL